MKLIQASAVYFIKLGTGGGWEEECLRKNVVRLGFADANHKKCLNGKWEQIHEYYLRKGIAKGTATKNTNQLRKFYESDPQTLRAIGVLPDAKRLAESIRNGTPISLNFKPARRPSMLPFLPVVEEQDEILV